MPTPKRSFDVVAEDIFSSAPESGKLWNRQSHARSIATVFTVIRTQAGMTQAEIAAKTGWNKAYISRLESAAGGVPDSVTIARYAEACGMEVGLVFASMKSAGLGHIHSAIPLRETPESTIFTRANDQDFNLSMK